MPIENIYDFITIDEFISWGRIDETNLNKEPYTKTTILNSIQVSSLLIDQYSKREISRKWPSENVEWTQIVKNAVAELTIYYLNQGTSWLRGSQSISQGSINFSVTNPNDPYYIPANVIYLLKKIEEYTPVQAVNLDLGVHTNYDINNNFYNGMEGLYRPTMFEIEKVFIKKVGGLVSTDDSIIIETLQDPANAYQRIQDIKVDLKINEDVIPIKKIKQKTFIFEKNESWNDKWDFLYEKLAKLNNDKKEHFISDIAINFVQSEETIPPEINPIFLGTFLINFIAENYITLNYVANLTGLLKWDVLIGINYDPSTISILTYLFEETDFSNNAWTTQKNIISTGWISKIFIICYCEEDYILE